MNASDHIAASMKLIEQWTARDYASNEERLTLAQIHASLAMAAAMESLDRVVRLLASKPE